MPPDQQHQLLIHQVYRQAERLSITLPRASRTAIASSLRLLPSRVLTGDRERLLRIASVLVATASLLVELVEHEDDDDASSA